jgi:hypothetical protein
MMFVDLSLPECLYLHLTQSLVFMILGPVHLQLQLYLLWLFQYCSPLLLRFLHQLLCQHIQPIYEASYYSICILYCL